MKGSRIEANLEKPELSPDGDETTCEIDVELTGETADFSLNIVFCIDVSGSMSGRKLSKAKTGTIEAIRTLTPDDEFAVVAFGSEADTLLPQTSGREAGSDRVVSEVENIRPHTDTGGGTDIEAGLDESVSQLRANSSLTLNTISETLLSSDSREFDWIVLLTDGKDSGYDPDRTGEELATAGITTHSVGIGNYDKRAVRVTAERPRGNWKHAETAGDIPEYFESWVRQARSVVATNRTLRVTPEHAAVEDIYYTVGGEQVMADTDRQNGDILVDLGDIRKDNSPRIFLDLDIPPHDPVSDVELVTLSMPLEEGTITETVRADFMSPALTDPDRQNPDVRVNTELARIGRTAVDGNTDDAIQQVHESDEIDDDVAEEVEQTLRRVEKGDKEATEEASTFLRLSEDS